MLALSTLLGNTALLGLERSLMVIEDAARMARESVRILPPEPGDGAGMLRRLNLAMVLTVMHDQSSSLPDGLGGEDWLDLALDQVEVVEGQRHLRGLHEPGQLQHVRVEHLQQPLIREPGKDGKRCRLFLQ